MKLKCLICCTFAPKMSRVTNSTILAWGHAWSNNSTLLDQISTLSVEGSNVGTSTASCVDTWPASDALDSDIPGSATSLKLVAAFHNQKSHQPCWSNDTLCRQFPFSSKRPASAPQSKMAKASPGPPRSLSELPRLRMNVDSRQAP